MDWYYGLDEAVDSIIIGKLIRTSLTHLPIKILNQTQAVNSYNLRTHAAAARQGSLSAEQPSVHSMTPFSPSLKLTA